MNKVVKGNRAGDNVEYCGYTEEVKGVDYHPSDPSEDDTEEDGQSERSADDENIYDNADTWEEAVHKVLNKRGENEMGMDFDRIKNER